MFIRITVLISVVVVLMLGLASCGGGSKYLLKGLTLPPGSVEKDFVESKHATPNQFFPAMGGKVKKSVTVSFDCAGGWDAVNRHIDGFMRGQGYDESMKSMDAMSGSIPGMSGMKMSDMMRYYMKEDAKYAVGLMNVSAMSGLAGGMAPPGIGSADFMMVVIEFE